MLFKKVGHHSLHNSGIAGRRRVVIQVNQSSLFHAGLDGDVFVFRLNLRTFVFEKHNIVDLKRFSATLKKYGIALIPIDPTFAVWTALFFFPNFRPLARPNGWLHSKKV
jgi:hypothetical protein